MRTRKGNQMRTEAEVRERLAETYRDTRLHQKCATIHENAPLALIQLEMEVQVRELSWALGEKPPPLKRSKSRKP